MIRYALFAILLLPGLAKAVICKTVGADGVVSYSDVPASECAQAVNLPDYSRYAPRPIERPAASASAASGTLVEFERYQAMSIVQPEADGTVRSNDGKVPVSIVLTPGLQQGHQVTLSLDGQPVNGGFRGLAMELSGVERGTHSLSAAVVDGGGQRLIEAPAVRFTLRKIGLNDPANKPTPVPPVAPAPPNYVPPAGPGYEPPAGPGYQPGSGSISTTPGRTNPAFAPKYTP